MTSQTSVTGNLGGLTGADATCQRLGSVADAGRTWRAYLSVERNPELSNQVTHAKDRIGQGPWYNVNLQLIANNLTELHSRTGDAALFLDERGRRINGQWTGSPTPSEHDILTGSNADGTLAVWPDVLGLDVRLRERHRRKWDIPTGWVPVRAPPEPCRRGTRRTRTRTARTPHRVEAQDAFTASP